MENIIVIWDEIQDLTQSAITAAEKIYDNYGHETENASKRIDLTMIDFQFEDFILDENYFSEKALLRMNRFKEELIEYLGQEKFYDYLDGLQYFKVSSVSTRRSIYFLEKVNDLKNKFAFKRLFNKN